MGKNKKRFWKIFGGSEKGSEKRQREREGEGEKGCDWSVAERKLSFRRNSLKKWWASDSGSYFT